MVSSFASLDMQKKQNSWILTQFLLITKLDITSLSSANVLPVGADETAETLWGGDLPDPKQALEENGFQMRHVVLTPRRRR